MFRAGETPLMLSARAACRACVRHLLEAGACVDRKNDRGQTATGIARAEGNARLTCFLRASTLHADGPACA
jgi:ferredoxin